jgi:tetratricopeptide (TPR) repeat protein
MIARISTGIVVTGLLCLALWPAYTEAQTDAQRAEAAYHRYMNSGEGALYRRDFDAAVAEFKAALSAGEIAFRAEDPRLARTLTYLGQAYVAQGRHTEAEPLLKRALAIREKELGPAHRDTAETLNALASFYSTQGRYADAEPLLKRALEVRQGPQQVAIANHLASLYIRQGRYAEAEPLLKRWLAFLERFGGAPPEPARTLRNLATLYYQQGRYAEAEPLFKRALANQERTLGGNHPDLVPTLYSYAALLSKTDREDEARTLQARAAAIWASYVQNPDSCTPPRSC